MKEWIKNELKGLGLQIAFLSIASLLFLIGFVIVGFVSPETLASFVKSLS